MQKRLILLIAVVAAAFFWWINTRPRDEDAEAPPATTPGEVPTLEGLSVATRPRYDVKDEKETAIASRGGRVAYGGLTVEIEPGTLDKDVTARVGEVANPDKFARRATVALSPAYNVHLPADLRREAKVTIAFDAARIPADRKVRDVRVFWNGYGEWVPLPSIVDSAAGTVSASVPTFSQVQAGLDDGEVELKSPTPEDRQSSDPSGAVTVYYGVPNPGNTSTKAPARDIADKSGNGVPEYVDRIIDAVVKARQVYKEYGFKQPEKVAVYVDALDVDGYVHKFTGTFYMDNDIPDDETLESAAAHEYFHVVQREYATGLSLAVRHYWLAEATAYWAETVVFPDHGAARGVVYSDVNVNFNLVRPLTFAPKASLAVMAENFTGGAVFTTDVFYASAPFFIFMEQRMKTFTRQVFDVLAAKNLTDIELINSVVSSSMLTAEYAKELFYYQDMPGFHHRDFSGTPRKIVPNDGLKTLTRAEPGFSVDYNVYALSSMPFFIFAFDDKNNPPFSGTLVLQVVGEPGFDAVLQCFPERNGHRLARDERGTSILSGAHASDKLEFEGMYVRENFGSFKMPGVACDTVAFLASGTGDAWKSGRVYVTAYVLDGPAGGRWDVVQVKEKNVYKISWASTPLTKNERIRQMLMEYRVYRRTPDKPFGDKPVGTAKVEEGEISFVDPDSNGEDPLIYGVQLADTGKHVSPVREIPVRLLDLTPFKLTNADVGYMENLKAYQFEPGGFGQGFHQVPSDVPPNTLVRFMLVDIRALKKYVPEYSEQKLIDEMRRGQAEAAKRPNPLGDVREISDVQNAGARFKYIRLKVTESVSLDDTAANKFTYSHATALIFWSEHHGILGAVAVSSQGKYETTYTQDKPPRFVFKSKDNPPVSLADTEAKALVLMNLTIGRIEQALK